MKKMLAAVMLVPLFVVSVHAQMGDSPAQSFLDKVSAVWKKQAFTATAVMQVEGAGKSDSMKMEYLMMVNGEKSRMEMDMGKMMAGQKGAMGGMPAGMEKMIMISRGDKKMVYQVMPGLQAYCETATKDGEAKAGDSPKIDRKSQGTEKVENYNCEKVLNTISMQDGKKQEVMTWEAKDLGGLPVKMEAATEEGKMTMLFKDIKTGKPADSMFEPPAGYKKYASMQELMMSAIMKNMPQQ